MIGYIACPLALVALAIVLHSQLKERVYIRNAPRPNLVVTRRILFGLGEYDCKCTACGWKGSITNLKSPTLAHVRRYDLPKLDKHQCPDIEKLTEEKEWEEL